MVPRSVHWAYTLLVPIALIVAFLGLGEVDQTSVAQTSAIVRADGGAGSAPNADLARRLERTADQSASTVFRVVADRSEPTARRSILTTAATGSVGQDWLRHGYPDFTRSMTTVVLPLSDLDRYDASGEYFVIGAADAVRAVANELSDAQYAPSTTILPSPIVAVASSGLRDVSGLVLLTLFGSALLCVIGTIGAPRRAAIRRMSGRTLRSHLGAELTDVVRAVPVTAVLVAVVLATIAFRNGTAQLGMFLAAVGSIWLAAVVPVVVVHLTAAVMAFQLAPAPAIRGARPGRVAAVAAQLTRVPAAVLLVSAGFDLVGSVAVARSGDADRDLRAAGDTVQLWVTGNPQGDVSSAGYWDALGRFSGRAVADGSAFLSAAIEVPDGRGSTTSAIIVDDEYLRRHPVRSTTGQDPLPGNGARILVPERLRPTRDGVVEAIVDWTLKDAPASVREHVDVADLAPSQTLYAHPGDEYSPTRLSDPVVIVVTSPDIAFSADQLGSWLSSGDVVFTSERAARRALEQSLIASEISAVVAVGQAAAERARRAELEARVDLGTWVGSIAVSVMVLVQGVRAHRSRSAGRLFNEFAAGWSPFASDRRLLLFETSVLVLSLATAFQRWWGLRPDPRVAGSSLDPASAASLPALALAGGTAGALFGTALLVVACTRRSTIAAHGKDR